VSLNHVGSGISPAIALILTICWLPDSLALETRRARAWSLLAILEEGILGIESTPETSEGRYVC